MIYVSGKIVIFKNWLLFPIRSIIKISIAICLAVYHITSLKYHLSTECAYNINACRYETEMHLTTF